MRNKTRPMKSMKHKSVTSMIDCPEISFQREERHGVMRLAFFENNDITPETWKDFDFNTLSTLILNRNIHQDLQEQDRLSANNVSAASANRPSGSKSHIGAPKHSVQFAASPQPEYSPPPVEYSPEPVYSPEPRVFVRKPPQVPRSTSAHATRPTNVARTVSSLARPANGSAKQTSTSKPAHNPRSASIPQSHHHQQKQQQQKQQQHQQQQQLSNTSSESKTFMNHSGQFLCDEPNCGKTFPSLRKLRHHKVVHSDEFPFICQFEGCGKRFKRKFGIDLHSTTHFDLDPNMYEKTSNNSSLTFFGRRMQYSMCKPCNQKFKTVHDYQDHMLRHGKEPFKCLVEGCGQTFSIWKSFQKHRASHYFNYFCKMDAQCGHSTSNLQLLKLHIYCCHFRRTLPENATLDSRSHEESQEEEEEEDDQQVDDQDTEEDPNEVKEEPNMEGEDKEIALQQNSSRQHRQQLSGEQEVEDPLSLSQESDVSTPRRDPRLRRNPPRSSTLGQQDYASINNGISLTKLTASSPQPVKRARPSGSGSQPNSTDKRSTGRSPAKVLPKRACASITSSGSQHSTPEKKGKSPLKVLPKRSAQRLPMSLIAAEEGSTEDDDHSDIGSAPNEHCNLESDADGWESRFKCHLCDYKFAVRFQLTKHLSTHLELSPDMYSATADAKVIQLTERRRREFYCDRCNVKFEKMSDLDVHMRKHAPRPYVCPFCPVPNTFKMAKQYLSHLYEHRFNYYCTYTEDCEFTINRKDALKLHIFRVHLDQKLPAYIENFAAMAGCNEWTEQ